MGENLKFGCNQKKASKFLIGQIVSFLEYGKVEYGMVIKISENVNTYWGCNLPPVYFGYTLKLSDGTRKDVAEPYINGAANSKDFVPTGVFEDMLLSCENGILKGTLTEDDMKPLFNSGDVVYHLNDGQKHVVIEALESNGQYGYKVKDECGKVWDFICETAFSATPPKNNLVK